MQQNYNIWATNVQCVHVLFDVRTGNAKGREDPIMPQANFGGG